LSDKMIHFSDRQEAMYSRMVSVKTASVIVLVLSFWIVALPAAAAEEGLVAHWDFNEGQCSA